MKKVNEQGGGASDVIVTSAYSCVCVETKTVENSNVSLKTSDGDTFTWINLNCMSEVLTLI